ncbi:hypothetical protein BDW22DRAFT_1425997 [Trametopsis cervina]|nr:hypothetical protein BDW22DRAFT_1425997 [Trametopsis cervina]
MAGANYMGGRRNAAKARIKDENGRLQKCHFGKQRLSILTKGLGRPAASLSSGLPMHPTGSSTEHIAAITLAHARRESLASYTNKNDAGYMRATTHIEKAGSSSIVKRKKSVASSSKTQSSPSSYSAANHPSKILQQLDESDPLVLRGTINKLLTQPDFAGLTGRETRMREEAFGIFSTLLSSDTDSYDDPKSHWIQTSPSTALMNPDFEPMDFDGDSGFLEAIQLDDPAMIRPSEQIDLPLEGRPSAYMNYGLPPLTAGSRHLSQRSHDCKGPRAMATSTRDLSPAISLQPSSRYSSPGLDHLECLVADPERSVLSPGESRNSATFLHRITTNYPFASASIYSGDSSSDSNFRLSRPTASSPSPAAFRLPSASGVSSPRFISDVVSPTPTPNPTAESEIAVEETLLATVDGNLFEDADPWTRIKGRLFSSRRLSAPQNHVEDDEYIDLFKELRQVSRRRGVGYRTPPTSPFTDNPSPLSRRSHNIDESEEMVSVGSGDSMSPVDQGKAFDDLEPEAPTELVTAIAGDGWSPSPAFPEDSITTHAKTPTTACMASPVDRGGRNSTRVVQTPTAAAIPGLTPPTYPFGTRLGNLSLYRDVTSVQDVHSTVRRVIRPTKSYSSPLHDVDSTASDSSPKDAGMPLSAPTGASVREASPVEQDTSRSTAPFIKGPLLFGDEDDEEI